jgi:hypothetical protein
MKRAWKTTACGVTSIVAATTRGKAMAVTYRSARDVGYRLKFSDVSAVRCPKHDGWAEVDETARCWGEEDLPKV